LREVLPVALAGSEFLPFYKSAVSLPVEAEQFFKTAGAEGEWGRGPVLRLTARVWRGSGAAFLYRFHKCSVLTGIWEEQLFLTKKLRVLLLTSRHRL
jgi:hypothetical protein